MLHERVAHGGSTDGLERSQAEAVESCVDFLASIRQEGDEVLHEQKVEIKDDDGQQVVFGTADVIVKHAAGNISVIDWKFGYNPVRDVADNAQLAAYCAAAMQMTGSPECHGYVFQPRIKNKCYFKFSDSRAIIGNIKRIITQAQSERLVLHASDEACMYCRARIGCPAFRAKYQRMTAVSPAECDICDEGRLVRLFEETKLVKSFVTQVEDAVRNMIEKTGRCGRYVFQQCEGSRQISDLNALFERIKDMVTPREFNSLCSVSIGKLDAILVDKIRAASDDAISRDEAKRRGSDLIKDLIMRGKPMKKIVESEG